MKIDEARTMVLTRYSKINGQTVVKKSDHNLLYCHFKQNWNTKIYSEKSRYEVFNFKSSDGIQQFKKLTSSDTLSKCFKGGDIMQESNQWLKQFKNMLQRSFKKIRITKPRQNSEVFPHMREKASFMQMLVTLEECLEIADKKQYQSIISKIVLVKSEIEEIEIIISNLISNRNVKKIKEHFLTLSESGSFSVPGMWALKKKFNFKTADVPTAKTDQAGNLITSRPGLLKLYKDTYIERLSPKEAREEYRALQVMKETLFNMRYEIASFCKSDDWSADQVQSVCKSLRNSKARDELGFVYELFKPTYAGEDVHLSLTKMFNAMKQQLKIPKYFEKMSITSFYKNRGSR